MLITFLGTGTSQGIPVIGCKCSTCTSSDPRDQRLRTSVFVKTEDLSIVIDTGPDFRQQMLTNNIQEVDLILLTHEHNDHVVGIDDIRPFNFMSRKDMPVMGLSRVLDDVRSRFSYIFSTVPYPGSPRIKTIPVLPYQSITHSELTSIQCIPIMHGDLPILGYRIGNFAYITDASFIHEDSLLHLKDLDVVVINALQHSPHYSHFTLEQAISMSKIINAKNTYFTHMSHSLGTHAHLTQLLPPTISLAYDGLNVELI